MKTSKPRTADFSGARLLLFIAGMTSVALLVSGCFSSTHVISKNYGLCVELSARSDVSYTASEDYETAILHERGTTMKIGVSSRPTAPAMLITQYHPVIRNGEKVRSDVATRLVDIYKEEKLQALSVIGTGVPGRVLYIEAFSDVSDRAVVSRVLGTVRKCPK
ncbi:MAG: hypothetical protein QM769_07900 [Pseudoxanthomonas sp.]